MCRRGSAKHGGVNQDRCGCDALFFPFPCGKRKVFTTFAVYLWDCPCLPASTWCPANRRRATRRRGRGAANQQAAAAVRTGRDVLGEGPDNTAQLFLLYHQAVKLKNDLKSKGCAGSTGVSCLWALGAFCANWTFFPPVFLDGLISHQWKGRATTCLECGVSSPIPLAPNCTRVSWGQSRSPAAPCLFIAVIQNVEVISVRRLHVRRPSASFI